MELGTIADLRKKYSPGIDHLDLDLIMAHILRKPREFILAHPEHKPRRAQLDKIRAFAARRAEHEPLAYILGHKEFYGLDFKVTPATLIPRPETELLVEEVLKLDPENKNIIDVGTGSGNIIVALAKNIMEGNAFFGTDISQEALRIAKRNAKTNRVSGKIKFMRGNLLDKFKNIDDSIIIANLPYLSREIYAAALPNVKKYEPKSALYSPQEGLSHYAELFGQISRLDPENCFVLLEISPEQKIKLPGLIKKHLPRARVRFEKDLSGKWRACGIKI